MPSSGYCFISLPDIALGPSTRGVSDAKLEAMATNQVPLSLINSICSCWVP